MSKHPCPEILAPAGDRACMEAAISQGADAVYFGLETFNARHRATNFSSRDLPEIMSWLHRSRVRGYVALNTLVFSDELEAAEELLCRIAMARVDAVIVQDWGLARLCREVAPDVEIHASTQMTLSEPRGLAMARELGVTRAVLPRELSIDEIAKVVQAIDLPVEVFVHGALCVSYSGQCLTSEAIGGRSANRGQCAQACRQPYGMMVDGKPRERMEGPYVLSPLDLASPEIIHQLAQLGVASLKIEGRLKGPEYVATTVRTYRKAVEAALEGRPHHPTPGEWQDLNLAYSRGFSQGFLPGLNHQTLVPGRHPKARGVRLGEIVARDRRSILAKLDESPLPLEKRLQPGDGVVLDEGRPEEREIGGRVWAIRRSNPLSHMAGTGENLLWIDLGPEDLPQREIAPGAILHKTDSPAFRQRTKEWIHEGLKDPKTSWLVDWTVAGEPGSALDLTASVAGLGKVSTSWEGPLEEASKTAESAFFEKSLGSLGGTPYSLGAISNTLKGKPLVPPSVLKKLRRELVGQLEKIRIGQEEAPGRAFSGSLKKLRTLDQLERKKRPTPPVNAGSPTLVVLVRSLEQVKTLAAWQPTDLSRPSLLWLDFEDPRHWEPAMELCRSADLPVGIAPLRIVKPGEEPLVARALRLKPDAVLARNLATLDLFAREAPEIPRVADLTLNVVNDLSAAWLEGKKVCRWTPGQDLNWAQFEALLRHVTPAEIEFVAHICMPMFHTEHCLYAANLSQGKSHLDCGRPCEAHRIVLNDPAGMRFPVLVDAGCRNTVYNSRAQSASEHLARLVEMGVRWFRVELLEQAGTEALAMVEGYSRVLAGKETGGELWRRLRLDHRLGLTRGTLNLA